MFRKKVDNSEQITVSFLRSLDKRAYTQFLKAVDIYREGDAELDKYRGKNLTSGEFMEE